MAKTKLFPRRNAASVRRPHAAPLPPTPPAPEAAKVPAPEPEPPPDRAASGKVVDRIGVPIDASGAFDLDSMRPATRSRFDAALKKTKFASAPANTDAEFRPIAVMTVDAVVSLQVMAASMFKCPPNELRHLAWNSAQRSVLADQLAAVLARHPQWMENAPEALLGATYGGFLLASVQAIRAEREGTNRAPVASVSEPPNLAESIQ